MKSKSIYLRVSTEEQTEESQLKPILDKFKLNINDCIILRDKVSAYKESKHEQRTDFLKLLSMINKKEITEVYIWDIDRIYRNYDKLRDFYILCRKKEIKVYSVRQDFINSMNSGDETFNKVLSDTFLGLLGWLAEDESKKKSERVKLKVDKKTGITKSIYGKKWGRKTDITLTDKEEIKELSKTLTYRQIQIRFQEKKKRLSLGTINKILKSN